MQRDIVWQDASIKAAVEQIKNRRCNWLDNIWLTLEYEDQSYKRIILAKTGRDYQEFINCFQEKIAMMGYLRHDSQALFVHFMSPDISDRDRVYSMIHAKHAVLVFPICSLNICISSKAELSVDFIIRELSNLSNSDKGFSLTPESPNLSSKGHGAHPSNDSIAKVSSSTNSKVTFKDLENNIFSDPGEELLVLSGLSSTSRSNSVSRKLTSSNSSMNKKVDNPKPRLLQGSKSEGDLKQKEENFWVEMEPPQPIPNFHQGPELNGAPQIMPKKAQHVLLGGLKKPRSLSKLAGISQTSNSSISPVSAKSPSLDWQLPNYKNILSGNITSPPPPSTTDDATLPSILLQPIENPSNSGVKLEKHRSSEDLEKLNSNQSKFSKRLNNKKQSTEVWVDHKAPKDETSNQRLLRIGETFLSILSDEKDPIPVYDIPISNILKATPINNPENERFGIKLATTHGVHILDSIDANINFIEIIMALTAIKTPKYHL